MQMQEPIPKDKRYKRNETRLPSPYSNYYCTLLYYTAIHQLALEGTKVGKQRANNNYLVRSIHLQRSSWHCMLLQMQEDLPKKNAFQFAILVKYPTVMYE